MAFTVDIDANRCQGHGKCMLACPDVFDSDEQGFAVLTAEDFDDDLRAAAQQAVLDCPEAALSIPD